MFHQPIRTQLITEAYEDFERRLKWRLRFAFEKEPDPFYDPDFEPAEFPNKKKAPAPVLPLYIENGFRMGRRFVETTIAKIPTDKPEDIVQTFTPPVRRIQQFLLDNDYIVTPTDKNLGLAVSKRTWIIEKTRELLNNPADYGKIDIIEADSRLRDQFKCNVTLSAIAEQIWWQPQLPKFFTSNNHLYSEKLAEEVIPTFYGIPKIHKWPVKFRPIVPCHSTLNAPAAIYAAKRLSPIVKSAPTIIHGSKDLAQKLSKLVRDSSRKCYFVSGDVVAYYPNIPMDKCLDIIDTLYDEYYCSPEFEHPLGDKAKGVWAPCVESEHLLFKKCLRAANENIMVTFENQERYQKRGAAMGQATSPAIANLYGYWFERQLKLDQNDDVLFYGRYIDDTFAIIYAKDAEVALNYCKDNIKFDGCTIEWSVSDQFCIFLDMRLYFDNDGQIHHMPYRKAHNHMERIPWISAHPYDVKRGTFVGELSRLATLSSLFVHYEEAAQGLVALYTLRGYPMQDLTIWFREHFMSKWQSRLEDNPRAKTASEVLVLKTEFNLAWNYFSAAELGETILGYWRTACERFDANDNSYREGFANLTTDENLVPTGLSTRSGALSLIPGDELLEETWFPDVRKILDIHKTRLITSRKRLPNLFDLTSTWKKIVLTKTDRFAAARLLQANIQAAQERADNIVRIPQILPPRLELDPETRYVHVRQRSPPAPSGWHGRD